MAERHYNRGTLELTHIKRAHAQEVDQLLAQVEFLRRQVGQLRGGPGAAAHANLTRRREALRAQIAEQTAAAETARLRAEEAERAAAAQSARLEEFCAQHEREIAQLWGQLPPTEALPSAAEECEDEQELLARYAELRGPASRMLLRFGKEPLESLSSSGAKDPETAAAWLQALAASMEHVAMELEQAPLRPVLAVDEAMAAAG